MYTWGTPSRFLLYACTIREQEIDFLTRTYNQMEGLQAELEQCKQQNRDLENTLAQANEEQEALAAQLYETGHALDEANNEV